MDGSFSRLWREEPEIALEAALDLVRTPGADGSLLAHAGIHAGSVIERDLDVFGRTVNLASRIAAVTGQGEVLARHAVVDAARGASLVFERVDERSLKGIEEPVALFRVEH
jgi:class 3 adenylate cyclase